MSVEAISWALNLAPVPMDAGGKRNPACKAVLVGLANHAGPDGRDAFPSVRTLVRYTDLSERTVRTALDRLAAAGIIRPCDPAIVAAKIKRPGYRPQGWDLAMHLVRDDLSEEDLAALEGQFPGLTERVKRAHAGAADQPDPPPSGRPAPGRRTTPAQPVDNPPAGRRDGAVAGVQRLHPLPGQGCNHRRAGVQSPPGRGAVAAPEPPIEPPVEPPASDTHTRARDPGSTGRLAADAVAFFEALPAGWTLSPKQRARLAPLVATAVAAGWAPDELARFAGANTAGVRSPYAVLAARLSPGELPAPPRPAPPCRPRWCGACDPRTRRLERPDGGDGGRCPRCHPAAAAACGPAPGHAAPAR